MRAVTLDRFGGPEVLTVTDAPDAPEPGTGEVRIRVEAAAINPVDLQVRRGGGGAETGVPFPMTLGWDVSGVVEAVGPSAGRFSPGTPVIGMSAQAATGIGTWAEYVTLHQDLLAHAPVSVPLADAAALPLAGLSTYQALDRLRLVEGSRLLVTGGVGALGGIAVQIARARGWRPIALVREKDQDLARSLGAAEVVTEVPTGAGYHALFETAGIAEAVDAVRDGGQAVTVVDRAMPKAGRGIMPVVSYVEQDGPMLGELAKLVDAGMITVRVARTFGFDEAADAVALMERGGVRGKILLIPSENR